MNIVCLVAAYFVLSVTCCVHISRVLDTRHKQPIPLSVGRPPNSSVDIPPAVYIRVGGFPVRTCCLLIFPFQTCTGVHGVHLDNFTGLPKQRILGHPRSMCTTH